MEKIAVLWVEDNEEYLNLGKTLLEKINNKIRIQKALSIEKGIDLINNNNFDAIISDFEFLKDDGLFMLKKLRQEGNTVPFIMLTGKGDEEIAMKTLNSGADHYYIKNFEVKKLFTQISHSIEKLVKLKETEKKLAIERRKFAELFEKYYLTLNFISEGIALEDENNNIIYANPKMLEIFEYSLEEVLSQSWRNFISPSDHKRVSKEFSERSKGEISVYKVKGIKKTGEEFSILIKGISLYSQKDNSFIGTLILVSDISPTDFSDFY
jgi:PAS domain S-box-containing protein